MSNFKTRALVALSLSLAAACGGPGPGSPDSGAGDAGEDVAMQPALPSLAPCRAGHQETEREGIVVCEPAAPISCEGTSFSLPGGDGCEPVDHACGDEPFPEVPSDRDVAYVQSGATGGDGTRALPFGSIAEALPRVSPTAVIAIAAGTYDGMLTLPDGIELRGVCAERVVLRGTAAGMPVVLIGSGRTATLRSLTITGPDAGVLVGGTVVLRGIALLGTHGTAIVAIGASSSVDAERVLVRDTFTDGAVSSGRGLEAQEGSVRLVSSVFERTHDTGVLVTGMTHLEDVAIRETLPDDAGRSGIALSAIDGATLTFDGVSIEGASATGLYLRESAAEGRDLVVRDVAADTLLANGFGVFVQAATLRLERAWIDRATRAGIQVHRGGILEGSDLLIEGTREAEYAYGLGAVAGSATITRLAVRDVGFAGVLVAGDEDAATVTLADLTVLRVGLVNHIGSGVLASGNASATIDRFALRETTILGAHALGGAQLTLRSGVIADVRASDEFAFGRGVESDDGARIELEDVVLRGLLETGIFADGGEASLLRVRVSAIAERPCVDTTCPGEPGGTGVSSVHGGSITARELVVEGAPLCGLQVAEDGSLDVESGEIRGCAIGACVQVPGYDLARVTDGVAYRDNATSVDTGGVFIPPAGPRVEVPF